MTPEAIMYLNSDLEFVFKGHKLTKEKLVSDNSYTSMITNVISSKRNLSGRDLMELYGDEDSNDSIDVNNKTFMNDEGTFDLDSEDKLEDKQTDSIPKPNKVAKQSLQLFLPGNSLATRNNSNSKSIQYAINSLYNDIPKLKSVFGTYKLFQGIEAEVWIEKVSIYLNSNYSTNIDEVCPYFYVFLSEDYHKWFFKNKLTTFEVFKTKFIEQSFDLLKDYHELMYSKQSVFMKLIKEKYEIDEESVIKRPIKLYFENKLKIFSKVFPDRNSKEIIIDSIMLLDKDEDKKRFYHLRNLDIKDLMISIKYSDW